MRRLSFVCSLLGNLSAYTAVILALALVGLPIPVRILFANSYSNSACWTTPAYGWGANCACEDTDPSHTFSCDKSITDGNNIVTHYYCLSASYTSCVEEDNACGGKWTCIPACNVQNRSCTKVPSVACSQSFGCHTQ